MVACKYRSILLDVALFCWIWYCYIVTPQRYSSSTCNLGKICKTQRFLKTMSAHTHLIYWPYRPYQTGTNEAETKWTTFRRRQFWMLFLEWKCMNCDKNWLNFVPTGSINNIPALVQIMAWRRTGDKPLSEPMMVSLPTHICVTRPQWVKNRRKVYRLFSVHSLFHMKNHGSFTLW